MSNYEYFYIHKCENFTVTAPAEVHLSVPTDELKGLSGCAEKSFEKGYACEDHFNPSIKVSNYSFLV